MMALYESHVRWRLDVVAGEWRDMNRPAWAPPQGAAPRGQDPEATDRVRAQIAVLEARLLQLRGPSGPQLSLGKLQRVATTPLHYAWRPKWCRHSSSSGGPRRRSRVTVSQRWQLRWPTANGLLCGRPSGSKKANSQPNRKPRKPLGRAPLGLASSTATGRANATCSSPSPPSNRSRNGSRRWRSRKPRGGARHVGSPCTETKPYTQRSVPRACMTRTGLPLIRA